MLVVRGIVGLLGFALVARVLISAVNTFVVPRGISDKLSRLVFLAMRRLFDWRTRAARSYEGRDQIMALYAPVTLLTLPIVWLALVGVGCSALFWAISVTPVRAALKLSGSSLLTLGFATAPDLPTTVLAFAEATTGLILVALLIAYLPTMYASFARREAAVALLAVRAGTPPSGAQLLINMYTYGALEHSDQFWSGWEQWFIELEESHTSLAALSFFRSPQPDRCWLTAAGAVLDASALLLSTIDLPRQPQAALCLRAGFLCLRRLAGFFRFRYNPDPQFPAAPIGVTRAEFDAACAELAAAGVPLRVDREQAWRDFAGWRVNYDDTLLFLSILIMAPSAPWSSDRALKRPFGMPSAEQAAELAGSISGAASVEG
jgi:hypothetical protein